MKLNTYTIKGKQGDEAVLSAYLIDNSPSIDENRLRPAVIICPGGGYRNTSDREAEAVAIKMMAAGYQALILRYSCAPAVFPSALIQLATSVALVREHAHEWHINADQIVISGFSAGAHVAASLGVFWKKEWLLAELELTDAAVIQPNALLLSYPVITSGEFAHRESFNNLLGEKADDASMLEKVSLERQVNADSPQTFIWHTVADQSVPVENSLLFVDALQKNKIPFSLHLFPNGRHGLSLATEETAHESAANQIISEVAVWFDLFTEWMHANVTKG